jgi:hypothetical protein
MKRHLSAAAAFVVGIVLSNHAWAQVGSALFSENFDSLTLGPSVNERATPTATAHTVSPPVPGTESIPNFFTHTPPAGWTVLQNFDNFGHTDLNNPNYAVGDQVGNLGIGNQGNPGAGVDEWEGWSFTDSDQWLMADTQRREEFRDGLANHSIVAVADPDEYDDMGGGLAGQYYNTGMSSGSISVAGKSNVNLQFDSSWRDESFDDEQTVNPALGGQAVNNQTAIVYASFDGGAPVQVTQFNSLAGDPNFKDDSPNEHLNFPVNIPAGAQNMKLSFAMINAGNDWWWAIDNLELRQGASAPFWSENFESVPLGPSVNERLTTHVTASSTDAGSAPVPNAFTHTPPAGWNIDNSAMGGAFDDDLGVFEWEGWTFSTNDFSTYTSNSQLYAFTKSTGNHAIADADAAHPLGGSFLQTTLETPTINLTGVAAGTLKLQFDSSWQTSGSQTAEITADYGDGNEIPVLNWTSDGSDPNFHGTNLNETVYVNLNNPAGKNTVKLRFKYFGDNDWFWAVDNLKVGPGGNADFNSDGVVDGKDFLIWQRGLGSGTSRAQGNADGDNDVDAADLAILKSQFGQTGLPVSTATPEPTGLCLAGLAVAAAGLVRRNGRRR